MSKAKIRKGLGCLGWVGAVEVVVENPVVSAGYTFAPLGILHEITYFLLTFGLY